jgi:hypothetical protein
MLSRNIISIRLEQGEHLKGSVALSVAEGELGRVC